MGRAEVVVVGTGVMGASAARALARRDHDVLLLEQFEVGHSRGSSHGAGRIFRFSYAEPMYVRMAMEALPLWRHLEAESGESLLITTGGLDIGPEAPRHMAALKECGARFEVLDAEGVRGRFPLSLPAGTTALFQPDAGVVAAERAWKALVLSAVEHGAELREHTTALSVAMDGGRAAIRLDDGEVVRADVVVVTAGAWARDLLAGADIALPTRPTRETVAHFARPGGEEASLPTLVEWGSPSVYALPVPGMGIKAGEHQAGPTVDPAGSGPPDESSIRRLSAWVQEHFPSVDPRPHHVETCLYTNTADEHFVLERFGPVVVGSPCSGHGFKFAPLIGERLADLALGDAPA
jgi:sarcosine oxidase